jgi:signal transduction histidine kinase/ActR/RegA family two-component response regulator
MTPSNSAAPATRFHFLYERITLAVEAILNWPVFNIGMRDELPAREKRNLKVVNVFSIITAFFALSGSWLLYILLIPDQEIVYAGAIEITGFACVIGLNRLRQYNSATLLFYLIQNAAIVYFGMKLDRDSGVQAVAYFMIPLSFFLFAKDRWREIIICVCISAVTLLVIECNQRYNFIEPYSVLKDKGFTVRTFVYPISVILNTLVTLLIISMKNDDFERANMLKSVYVREMSHELRTPLNAAFGIAQQLYECKDEMENKEIRTKIECLYTATFQTLGIVNNALDLSKIEAGHEIDNLFEPIPLRKSIEDLILISRQSANFQGKGIELTLSDDLPEFISFDKLSLTKIFNNLLSNAIKYTQKDGLIKVRAFVEHYKIYCVVSNPGSISKSEFENIFKPFSGEKRNGIEGTGLGLHITKRLLEKLGGGIELDSEHNETVFSINFPWIMAEKSEEMTITQNYDFKGNRILVVDDSEMGIYILKTTVAEKGAEVITASDGAEALEIIRSQHIDLVISDSVMPGMGATEMLRQLRIDPLYTTLPVIVVAGVAFDDDRLNLIEAGASGFLSKPFIANELFDLVNKQLSEKPLIT